MAAESFRAGLMRPLLECGVSYDEALRRVAVGDAVDERAHALMDGVEGLREYLCLTLDGSEELIPEGYVAPDVETAWREFLEAARGQFGRGIAFDDANKSYGKVDTRDTVSKAVGVAASTYTKAKRVVKAAEAGDPGGSAQRLFRGRGEALMAAKLTPVEGTPDRWRRKFICQPFADRGQVDQALPQRGASADLAGSGGTLRTDHGSHSRQQSALVAAEVAVAFLHTLDVSLRDGCHSAIVAQRDDVREGRT